jgi:hypothetical protein
LIASNMRHAASCRIGSPVMRYKMKTDSIASGLYKEVSSVSKQALAGSHT